MKVSFVCGKCGNTMEAEKGAMLSCCGLTMLECSKDFNDTKNQPFEDTDLPDFMKKIFNNE